jgi:hypothetical protein
MPRPLAAQFADPITLDVRAGFDSNGMYRARHWFPVSVTIANAGPDLQAQLVWEFTGSDESFRYDLDLPRSARKQIILPVLSTTTARNARLILTADGRELGRTPVQLNPIQREQMLIGVMSTNPTMLNSLNQIAHLDTSGTAVAQFNPVDLPSDPMLLTGLDVLFIHDTPTNQLSDAQLAALKLWTQLGGQLVVGGGVHADATTAALRAWLPVTVGPLRSDVVPDGLERLARRNDLLLSVPTLTVNEVSLLPGARELDTTGQRLLSSYDLGAGRVIFAAFDLAALRVWGGEADLWKNVVRPENRFLIASTFRHDQENLLRSALQFNELRLPSVGVLTLLILLYITVVGPINFWGLRRMGKVEWAWVTTPALVVLFLVLAYGYSFLQRGTNVQLIETQVVQGFAGQVEAQATSFVGVFSPQRRSYAVQAPPVTLLTPGSLDGFRLEPFAVTNSELQTSVDDLLVDVSALRTLLTEQPVEAPLIQSDLTFANRAWTGTIQNQSSLPLEDLLLVRGDAASSLGSLAPGQTLNVSAELDPFTFPNNLSIDSTGTINRYQVLTNLFSYDRYRFSGPNFQQGGLPETDALYLIGWTPSTPDRLQVNGTPRTATGETLYIIRLGTP